MLPSTLLHLFTGPCRDICPSRPRDDVSSNQMNTFYCRAILTVTDAVKLQLN